MLINVALPWYRAQAIGRAFDVLSVNLVPSELDGEVCIEGQAVSLVGGEGVKLPPYIAAKDIAAFVAASLGADFGTSVKVRLD